MKNSLYKPILAMLILFSIVILPLISANTFAYNYLELKEPSGNITNEYINNTYINQTANLSAYWLSNGSSTATGNWDIGTNVFQSDNINMSQEISLLRQQVYELKTRLEKLEKETCEVKLFSWCIK